jgi:hypothetical protein
VKSNEQEELIFPYFKLLSSYSIAIPIHVLNSFYEEQTNPESSYFNQASTSLKEASEEEY